MRLRREERDDPEPAEADEVDEEEDDAADVKREVEEAPLPLLLTLAKADGRAVRAMGWMIQDITTANECGQQNIKNGNQTYIAHQNRNQAI